MDTRERVHPMAAFGFLPWQKRGLREYADASGSVHRHKIMPDARLEKGTRRLCAAQNSALSEWMRYLTVGRAPRRAATAAGRTSCRLAHKPSKAWPTCKRYSSQFHVVHCHKRGFSGHSTELEFKYVPSCG